MEFLTKYLCMFSQGNFPEGFLTSSNIKMHWFLNSYLSERGKKIKRKKKKSKTTLKVVHHILSLNPIYSMMEIR